MTSTNFFTGSTDLKDIFYPRQSSDPILSYNTGFIVNNNDIRNLFYPYTSGTYASNTYFYVNNQDLNLLFQNKNVSPNKYTITAGNNTNVTTSNNLIYFDINISDNTITNTGYSTILFNAACTVDISVIGGGGYGGFYNTGGSPSIGGGGGGGGDVQTRNNISVSAGTTYYIVVGNGSKDYDLYKRGYTSYFSTSQLYNYQGNSLNSNTIITSRGGDYAQSNLAGGTGGPSVNRGGNGAYLTTAAQNGTIGTSFTINSQNFIYGSGGPGGMGNQNGTVANYPANGGVATYGDGGLGLNYTQGDAPSNTNISIGKPGRVILYVR